MRTLLAPVLLLPVLLLLPFAAFAEQASLAASVEQNKLCLGYQQDVGTWGSIGPASFLVDFEHHCPANTAFIAVDRIGGPQRAGRHIPIIGTCCPVPKDLLTDEHRLAEETCPEGSVATGTKTIHPELPKKCVSDPPDADGNWQRCSSYHFNASRLMRCTLINTKRYKLGPALPAQLWGTREHLSHNLQSHVQRANIPAAIRHAVGRRSLENWYKNGCIGYPYGSLLSGKSGKRCGLTFRQVQYAGQLGDPAMGTPVQMFPKCKAVSDRFDPNARCIK